MQIGISLALKRVTGIGSAIASLFRYGDSGSVPDPSQSNFVRQTYNAPATTAASAGDPIGLMMPSQSNEQIINFFIWTDDHTNAAYTKTAVTVTSNVVADPNGVPIADVLTATSADSSIGQGVSLSTNSTAYTYSVYLKAPSSTNVNISVVTNLGTVATQGITVTTSWQRFSLTGTTQSSGVTTVYGVIGNGNTFSTGEVLHACREQLNIGSTALAYQPNADCLGGSNRRTGGSNMLLWSEDFANPGWSKNDITVTIDSDGRADKLVASTNNLGHNIQQAISCPSSAATSFSVSAKPSGYNWIALQINGAGGGAFAYFNVSTGVVGTTGNSPDSTSITADPNNPGYYICRLTKTTSSNSATCVVYVANADNVVVFAGDGTSGVLLRHSLYNIGTTADTYYRNMDQLGGLLQAVVPFQSTSANRGTLARRPLSGIRNRAASNAMAGVVAGTPGTPSTDWTYLVIAGGLTRTIVGSGTENGIPYSEIRVFGTTSNANGVNIGLATAAAVTGETWTNSLYHRLIAGSLTGITNFLIGVIENTSGGVFVAGTLYNITAPTSSALDTQRYSATRTFSGGATVGQNAQTYLINIPTATTVDFTIRIGGVQPEKAAAASAFQLVTSASNITESGQLDVWHTYYDGVSDYADTGVQSYGSASLLAAAGQAWTVWGNFRCPSAPASTYVIVSKTNASAPNNTLLFRIASSGIGQLCVRGSLNTLGTLSDAAFHVWALRWDGAVLTYWQDSAAGATKTAGSQSEEARNILISATGTGTETFLGHNDVAMIDRALTDAEVTNLMAYLNATYRAGL